MAKSNPLNHFAQHNMHNMRAEEIEDMLEEFKSGSVEKHIIKVKGGELRVLVEDGIPKITYLADGGDCFVQMLSGNSLRFIYKK